ncbi:ABC-2 type transport system permease protein [Actinokineospora alba]|uniref:ABC-2 type transport system permease protein n=1 Tax=Actinokineospora alba TaxID=504798 RepID=A0A1H0RLB3_9PSEU|nr:hypothetical protein [Actinokineospora alba]TDP67023.1 ABC-2 type transport system permease protein [Actinokineospora alba]SDJ31458.1 ABC-2 type transport system permease protein [Actinokineospora alba]SDP30291.1 ABC-2 type transport system permease protein [Actinokineospora alba]
MKNTMLSEWLKIRSLRSSWAVPVVAVLTVAVGGLLAALITAEFDRSTPERQALFASADMSVVLLPLVELTVAAVAALVITGEYGTGSIRPTMVGVPRRSVLFGAKSLVVGAAALVTGLVASFAMYALSWIAVGDRPAPIRPWESVEAGLTTPIAGAVAVTVVALLALGLGTALRSTAGAVVSVTVLIFVVPIISTLLPAPWDMRVYAVSLLHLPPQLAGTAPDALLSQGAALLLAAGYALVPLAVGAWLLARRDA